MCEDRKEGKVEKPVVIPVNFGDNGHFLNKTSGSKFRKYNVLNGYIPVTSKIRKSGTGDNSYARMEGTFCSDC